MKTMKPGNDFGAFFIIRTMYSWVILSFKNKFSYGYTPWKKRKICTNKKNGEKKYIENITRTAFYMKKS